MMEQESAATTAHKPIAARTTNNVSTSLPALLPEALASFLTSLNNARNSLRCSFLDTVFVVGAITNPPACSYIFSFTLLLSLKKQQSETNSDRPLRKYITLR